MQADILHIQYDIAGRQESIYPVLLRNGQDLFLVDCGYAGSLPQLEKEARRYGVSLARLTGIIITHYDIDHLGCLSELKEHFPSVKVYASAIEANYISGKEKSPRLKQAEDLYEALPEVRKPWALHFQDMLRSIPPVAVDEVFPVNAITDFTDDLKIIPTPGHTPGHISLFLEREQILVAGDAMLYHDGAFDIANPEYTLDRRAAVDSIREIREWAPRKIICYHGGPVEKDIPEKLENLIAAYNTDIFILGMM